MSGFNLSENNNNKNLDENIKLFSICSCSCLFISVCALLSYFSLLQSLNFDITFLT
uniref:Uncharacterized protein n=1 Tax=Schmidtea mediterranea TaxID=79327 RepID=I1ZI81_SCHMD|nr:hypothetical protein [Schmidtea mediterranea]